MPESHNKKINKTLPTHKRTKADYGSRREQMSLDAIMQSESTKILVLKLFILIIGLSASWHNPYIFEGGQRNIGSLLVWGTEALRPPWSQMGDVLHPDTNKVV